MLSCDTFLRAGVVLTQNAERDVLENAGIGVDNGRIVAIGPYAETRAAWLPKKEIDLFGALVTPGLINAHAHGAMTFLRGLADDLPLLTWLEKHVFPVESRLTREITRMGALLGHAEMLASGVTACADMYLFEEEVFAAAEISGIRVLGGEAVFDFPSAACANPEEALARTEGLARKYAGNDKLRVAVNPHSAYTVGFETLRKCAELAEKLDLPVHVHLAETREETELCLKKSGHRPTAILERAGIFARPTLAAHLVDVTGVEAEFLAATKTVAVHNPASNMKLASGVSPVPMLLEKGVTVALGTDGPASNNALNLVADMRLTALLAKLDRRDPAVLPAARVFDMATLGGAVAFGDPLLGSLETGKKADLAAFDLSAPNMRPLHNPVSQMVYAASGHECVLTMIGGETVYEKGRWVNFDYAALNDEIDNLRAFAAKKI